MTFMDFIGVFQWWIIFLLMGLTFLPLASLLFSTFFDKGYILAKILGLLLVTYSIWLLSSLHLLPFNALSIFLLIGIGLVINLYLLYKKQLLLSLMPFWKIFLGEELLFTLGFFFWVYVKSFEPSIHGLEKYMDFGFINSILRSTYLPPLDLWLTPFSINYYYFGHFLTAFFIKITNILPEIGFNLMLATLFGLCLTASFSIGANLFHFFVSRKSSPPFIHHTLYIILSGSLSAFLVTMAGNLHTIYAFVKTYSVDHPLPFWQLLPSLNFANYWYPNATRFIPFTIHEFPIYSFVVSDLHGHVLNIPFVLLFIALLIKFFFSEKLNSLFLILAALLIAVFLMTNVLDGPIYFLGFLIILIAKKIKEVGIKNFHEQELSIIFKSAVLVLIGTIIFSLPFWLNFKPFGSGIGVLCAPQFLTDLGKFGIFIFEKDHCARSPLWMLLILWGFFYTVFLSFLILILGKIKKVAELSLADYLVITLTIFATILIIIPEFVYVKDIYPAHYRANTVFKFGYQAFIILGLVSGYMLTRMISNVKSQMSNRFSSYSLLTFAFLLFTLVSIYPYFAINSYFGGLKNYQGLNGIQYLNNLYPTDYQAILWLKQNIKNQPVILEAQGDSYTDYARVSANTGLPTVVGWPVHEWLWRGSYDEAGKRSAEVTTLYESPDLELTKQLLKQYQVKYVFMGVLEKQKYPKLNAEKFNYLGKIIYQNGETKIYQLNF